MSEFIDRIEGRDLFGTDTTNYDNIRPPYPEQIYQFLIENGALLPNTATLEIGAGNGLATRRLLELGANPLTLIEPDNRFSFPLESIAKLHSSEVNIVTSAFEDAELPVGHFDLVVAATSFHWIEPSVGLAKIAELLRPGGYAALWWNVFGDLDRQDPFHDATYSILKHLSSSPSGAPNTVPFALDIDARLSDFERTGRFDKPVVEVYKWTLVLTSEQVGALYATFSSISRLPEYERENILEQLMDVAEKQFDGTVERNMVSPIYIAKVF